MTKKNTTRYVFWTSGWDSTYMVIKLLRDGYEVQPLYILNPKRKSRHRELVALEELSRLISEQIKTGKLLPYQIINLKTIKKDPEIIRAFDSIMEKLPQGQRPLGYQYRYLASFARQHPEYPVIAIGLERALCPDQCACSSIIRQFGKLTPEYRIDDSSLPELVTLLGKFDFPIMDTTEEEMVVNIKKWGYEDIMKHIWFCHRPIRGEPCGFCNPCSSKVISHMEFLLPELAKHRNITFYPKLCHVRQKYGHFIGKCYDRVYRLFHS